MRRLFTTLVMALGVLASTAGAAQAQVYTLTASLSGSDETPTINTGAFGNATVTLDVGARTITYQISVFNLPSGVTASHIHVGGPNTTGPVIVNFAPPVPASNDFGFSGTVAEAQWVMRADQGIRSGDDVIQALLGGNTYVNVHSTANTGGEVRGRLTLKP